jgi:hypothetical protein
MIVGCNPFYGFAHLGSILATVMRALHARARATRTSARFGINAQLRSWPRPAGRAVPCRGRAMHSSSRHASGAAAAQWRPLAIYHHGERIDVAFRDGKIRRTRLVPPGARCRRVMVGVGTHSPR